MTRSAAALVGLCAIAAAGLTASCFSERTTGATVECTSTSVPCLVNIRDFAFEPATLRVRAGATVRWVNQGPTAHTSTADDGAWDSPTLATGAEFSQGFPTAGQFPYHCEPHPTMRATIIVE
ncbi:MAG: cupredoxin family copper-binding protein [Gemmatimonadaceae bacterium]